MGYYTIYNLEYKEIAPISKICEYCNGTGKIIINNPIANEINKRDFILNSATKWYEHEEDMKQFSKKFPDTLFTLKGIGEESGDIWVKYFKNGKMQTVKAKIEISELDRKSVV